MAHAEPNSAGVRLQRGCASAHRRRHFSVGGSHQCDKRREASERRHSAPGALPNLQAGLATDGTSQRVGNLLGVGVPPDEPQHVGDETRAHVGADEG